MNIDAYEEDEEYRETEEERRMRDERFVEKFFTERELIVEFDDTSDSDEKNAQAWYKAVEQTMNTLPIYQHDNVGQPPNSFSTNKKGVKSKSESGAWFFRGQKDVKFAFNSTLYRQLLHKQRDRLLAGNAAEHEQSMLEAEKALLRMARNIGIGRGLTGLETLSLLQHHGSPTRLIDVTSDWQVALFFACESEDDRDGRVFLIKLDPGRWRKFPKADKSTERDDQLVWEDYTNNFLIFNGLLPDNDWISDTWPILLPFSDPRMISQRGFFLVGGVSSLDRNQIIHTSRCPECTAIRCECSDMTIEPRSKATYKQQKAELKLTLPNPEWRIVTALTIRFETDRAFLSRIRRVKYDNWPAVGYSIRIPKQFKRTLRDILRQQGVHTDSIYPPLRDTVHLFEHVVDESLKQ